METLVVVEQERSHHHHGGGRSRSVSSHFSSPPSSRGFRAINCRAFHSGVGVGILQSPPPPPPPLPDRSYSTPEPRSSMLQQHSKRSRPGAISRSPSPKGGDFTRAELWAGPAFSNSPPPSSLPMPRFSLRQKRSVSLELQVDHCDDVEIRAHAKSVPSSPTKVSGSDFFSDTAIATENLRRILHLDIADD